MDTDSLNTYGHIAFTPEVLAVQAEHGSVAHARRLSSHENVRLGPRERDFIQACESFFMATVNTSGWPYVQHRGGPRGFLGVRDEHHLHMLDLRGNRQYLSVANLRHDARVALILVDYQQQRRLKLFAHAEEVPLAEVDAAELAQLPPPPPRQAAERLLRFEILAYAWNCSQQIPRHYSADELAQALAAQHQRITELEATLAGMA